MAETTLDIEYLYNEHYNPAYVNGAYGGIAAPTGELIIHFYMERVGFPEMDSFIKETGELTAPSEKIVRKVESGIILNYATAKEFHRWLGERVDAIDQIIAKHSK